EPLISALPELDVLSWLRDIVPYLPFTAGMQLVTAGLSAASQGGDALGRWEGGAVFAAFTSVLLVIGWLLFERRDA
ncbi:MAG TPA: hypothetical protein VNT24_01195, partial [Propionibacteriaceae bacterium]|nr:hypothetical protein [Propionibacteriaceae bacterium]